jgi:hypothetical protein
MEQVAKAQYRFKLLLTVATMEMPGAVGNNRLGR